MGVQALDRGQHGDVVATRSNASRSTSMTCIRFWKSSTVSAPANRAEPLVGRVWDGPAM